MILYTIIPLETVLDGSVSYTPLYSELALKNGGTLLVEKHGPNSARVVRLISSNPLDYLDPHLLPGKIVDFKAANQA